MDVIGSHAARLPAIDARWEPGPWERDELLRALVDGGMAGNVILGFSVDGK